MVKEAWAGLVVGSMAGVEFVSEKKSVGEDLEVSSVARFGSSLIRRYLNEVAPLRDPRDFKLYAEGTAQKK